MRKVLYIDCIFLVLSNLRHSRFTLLHVLPLSRFFPAPPPSDLLMKVSNLRVRASTLVFMLRFSVTVCSMKEHIALICRVNPETQLLVQQTTAVQRATIRLLGSA